MARRGVEPARRKALVDAAIGEIGRTGSLDVTVSQIARRAGMSPALAHHYFGSKEQMFLAAMRRLLADYAAEVRRGLEAAPAEPRARVMAILNANFADASLQPEAVAAWLSFYVRARRSESVARLLHIYHRRLRSNLLRELRPLAGERAEVVALGLGALIDGLYIRRSLESPPPPREACLAATLDYLDLQLGPEAGR